MFSRPGSPYARLMVVAGCEPGDVRRLVAEDGLEGALTRLAQAGVYVAFDELKGRRAAVRGSQRLWFRDREFDNPNVTPHFVSFTSGSGGRPSRVLRSLQPIAEQAATPALALAAHGIEHSRHAHWTNYPIDRMILQAKLGRPVEAWFFPQSTLPWQARLSARYLQWIGKVAGVRFPSPRPCAPEDGEGMARELYRRQRGSPPLVVNAITSMAVRAALAAERAGLDLSGVTFILDSEPVTEARLRPLRAVGARVIVNYASMELSGLAYSCATGLGPDDLHFSSDRFAVVEREREATPGGPMVRAMLFTALRPFVQKIAINVELGDSARIERRACGCELGALGLTTHLSEVRSFEKLSGEGVTLARSELLHVLESVMPERFGGSSVDYQLVEEESTDGSTRLVVRVDPSVGPLDEAAVCETVLAELRREDVVTQYHAELLERAGTLRVLRQPPIATAAGKVLPFHLARLSAAESRRR